MDTVAGEAAMDRAAEHRRGGAGADPDGPRGGRPRDEAREQAILDAAIDLVAEVGYDRMTMDAVAARARASKATIYRRWPSKADLTVEAVRRRVVGSAEPPDTGSLRGDLLAVSRVMTAAMSGVDGGLLCGLAVAARSDPELGRMLHGNMHEQKLCQATRVVERAKARGELGEDADPQLLLEVAPAVCLMRLFNGGQLDERFTEHLIDDILIPILTAGGCGAAPA